MFQILAALGRITGVMQGVGDTMKGIVNVLDDIAKLGLYGLGGVTLDLSQKLTSAIENTPFFKKFNVDFGSKYMTPFGTQMYWDEIRQQIYRANKQMGIAGQLSKTIESNIIKAGTASLQLGFSEKEIVETYKDFINEYERNDIFSAEDLERITKLNVAFDQSFNKLFATNRLYGGSIKTTYNFLETLNKRVDRFGLNSKKVFLDIQNNIRLIDRYNFKAGQDGLANMVITANKLGMQMDEIAGFAEKVYNPEDAIEAAAGLQMLGGEFSKLGDPFTLMYNANNDMEAFTKNLGNVTKGMGALNKITGQIDLSSLEFRQLREFSKITGQSLENLAKQAKLSKKEDIISQFLPQDLSNYGNIDEFISKLASMSEFLGGVPKIKIDGVEKLISQLSKTDLDKISTISVTPEGESFDGLIKSNQTLGEQVAIFSQQFTRAINRIDYLSFEVNTLNNLLATGRKSLDEGNFKNFANLINESKKTAALNFDSVVSPIMRDNYKEGFSNAWENINFQSSRNIGTANSMIDMMGGKNSGGGKVLGAFFDLQSALHGGISDFASSVTDFGNHVKKLTTVEGLKEAIPDALSNVSPLKNIITPLTYTYDYISKNQKEQNQQLTFQEQDKALKLFNTNREARLRMQEQILSVSRNEVEIKAANGTQKIEFSYNGEIFDVYDLLENEKFKQLLRQDMGDMQANMLLSNFTNGGKTNKPLDTIPR